MMRIGSIVLVGLTTLGCVSLVGCMDDAAQQHANAAKAIDEAAIQLSMLSPDADIAGQGAQRVLNTLRSVDVQSGPLASVRSALSAKAQLVLGEASLAQSRMARREVALLGGRIEARFRSLQRLQSFAQNVPFSPRQLGADALERGIDDRSARRRQSEVQIDAIQQEIDKLSLQRDQDAREIAESRNISHEQRAVALQTGNTSSIPDLEHAGASLASLAPLETRLELLGMSIATLKDQQRQLRLVVDGETSTIEAIETESADLRGFISARSGQVDSMQDRIQTLRRDLLTDASALASAEAGPLHDSATAAMGHFDAAASDAKRAARQAGSNAMADRVLELAARQSSLTTSVSRFMSLNRNASLLDRLASQGNLDDAAALRDQARSLATQRDDAMETARTAAQAAVAIADQLGDGVTAEAIRSRLGSMQDLLEGKPITVTETVVVPPAPMPEQPVPSGDAAGGAPAAAAITFIKGISLASMGDPAGVMEAKSASDCTAAPAICELLDVAVQLVPAMARVNSLAAKTFTGPNAMGIQMAQGMLDPEAMKAMLAPMLDSLSATQSTIDNNTATVLVTSALGESYNLTLTLKDGAWLVTAGTMDSGQNLTGPETIAPLRKILAEIEMLKTQIESGQIDSAESYLKQFEAIAAELQELN